MLYIMNNLNTKQEYWNARKLYRVLKDDTYSYLEVYSYICFFVLCLLHLLPCHLFYDKNILEIYHTTDPYFCRSTRDDTQQSLEMRAIRRDEKYLQFL